MDNVTLTFLQGLADLLGMLPQQTQADPTRGQSNRGGITSSRTRRQGQRTSSRNRSDRAGRSTATVTSDATTRPGAIVRSPRGQLATQPSRAIVQSPGGAVTGGPDPNVIDVVGRGNPNTANPGPQTGQPGPNRPQLEPGGTRQYQASQRGARAAQGTQGSGTTTGQSQGQRAQAYANQTTSTRGYRGLGAEVLNESLRGGRQPGIRRGALRGGGLQALAEIGGMLMEQTLGRQLGKGIFDLAANDPNTMAGRAAQRGITAAEYMDAGMPAYQGPGIPRRLLEGNVQPTTTETPTRPIKSDAELMAPVRPTQNEQQSAVPQAQGAGVPPAAAPAAVPTARQLQKQDFDRQYDEKRAAALAISDPMARAKALEDVTTFGLQLHKEYFAKQPYKAP